tara:strand:- start:41 stop:373 length:333 start_codon:yes stop_codon:yes gene_type:complete
MNKTVESNSELEKLDTNGDNVISQKEFEESEREIRLELLRNKDQKDDAQRKMCYYALAGMLLYGPLIVLTSFLQLDNGAKMLADIASVYYISVSGLIAAYFGFSSAFPKK